jgi:hypothetical protein
MTCSNGSKNWTPIKMVDGGNYENTMACWQALKESARDARYNGLVDVEDFIDQRNNETIVHLNDDEAPAGMWIGGDGNEIVLPDWPTLQLSPPTIPQPFHLEVVAEKTTVDDIVLPLGEQYGINVTSCAGQISLTRCYEIVQRAKTSGRPTRVTLSLRLSGQYMPVAAARKIEFLLRNSGLKLDIQLRHVLLTPEQCRDFALPRVPLKDSDRGKSRFETRYGEGATELDALEALHPGALKSILEGEIDSYYDHDLDERIEEVAADIEVEIDAVNETVQDEYQSRIEELEAEYSALEARRRALRDEISDSLRDCAPHISEIEWPEPAEGDDDLDPLFDSQRSYVEQMDRYKLHQDKPTMGARRRKQGRAA